MIDGETAAIDSFKIRGNNSLKNNFNDKKLNQYLAYIDAQIKEYEVLLDAADKEEDKKEIQEKIQERKEKQTKYKKVKKDLEASGEEQISLTDSGCTSRDIAKDIGLYPVISFNYDPKNDWHGRIH